MMLEIDCAPTINEVTFFVKQCSESIRDCSAVLSIGQSVAEVS